MSTDIAISVRGLSKSYTIVHEQRESTLAEQMLKRLRNPFRRAEKETFWALNDVSFDIKKGDVVGIIGRNGAGKSTLLKVLSRITTPTRGEIDLYGRVGSLLEVGTGFHPELTGRENIYLNGAILGMRRHEISRQFDAIVDFAGVEQFLDTPVKRYSSGMYVRLAFAVAAHLNPEIMIVDEVLAVGDAEFQRKCLGKMKDVAASGRTVLFVSHNMQSVSVLCNRGMYMEKGQVTYAGSVTDTIEHYMESFTKAPASLIEPQRRGGTGEYRFTSVVPQKPRYASGEEIVIKFALQQMKTFTGKLLLVCQLFDEMGNMIVNCDSRLTGDLLDPVVRHEGQIRIRSPWLKPGRYRVDMYIGSAGMLDKFLEACVLDILPVLPYGTSGNLNAVRKGTVLADFAYEPSVQ